MEVLYSFFAHLFVAGNFSDYEIGLSPLLYERMKNSIGVMENKKY